MACDHGNAQGIATGDCDTGIIWCPDCGALTVHSDIREVEFIPRLRYASPAWAVPGEPATYSALWGDDD